MAFCYRMHDAGSVRRVTTACGVIHPIDAIYCLNDVLGVVSCQQVPLYRQRGGIDHGLIGPDLNIPASEGVHASHLDP